MKGAGRGGGEGVGLFLARPRPVGSFVNLSSKVRVDFTTGAVRVLVERGGVERVAEERRGVACEAVGRGAAVRGDVER